ncbi:MAG TPA: AtpZ/AtpI family protein [Patescibacteria group bacterium]|nr:AtpZ/AtpI family protein [Patescibacteria group bacterium]
MKDDDKRQMVNALGLVGGIGLNLVATVAVGLFLGRALDTWLDSSPWGAAAGIIAGMLSGLWATYKRLIR